MKAQRSVRVTTAALILGIPLIGIFLLSNIPGSKAAALEAPREPGSEPMAVPELDAETISFLPGTFDGIDFSGNYAFVAESLALTALDISDPAQPVVVGRLMLPTRLFDVRIVNDSIAYVVGSDLYFVDISDPTSMEILGSFPTFYTRKIEIRGNLAFMSVSSSEVYVLHIQNPLAPILISVYDSADYVNDIDVHGDYVYLVGSNRLEIAKIGESGILELTGSYLGLGSGRDLWLEGDLVFIADVYKGLVIIDAGDPSNPVLLSIYVDQEPSTIAVKGDVAYIEDYFLGLILIDVSDPTQPQFISNDPGYRPTYFSILGDLLFLFSYDSPSSLVILNVSDPSAPVFQGRYPHIINSASYIHVSGNLLFTVNSDGLIILDIGDPLNPTRIGLFEHINLDSRSVMVEGDRAYVRGYNLMILDISDPTNPVQIGETFTYSYEPTVVEDMVVYHAFDTTPWGSSSFTGELRVIDTHNPISATVVYTTEIAGAPGEMDAVGGVLALELVHSEYPWTPKTLQLFDLSNPIEPELSGQIQNPFTNITAIELTGDLLYFSSSYGGVGIVDISDLDNPILIGLYPEQPVDYPYYWGLEVVGDRLYSHFGKTIQVLNIADPAQPTLIGQITSEAYISDVSQHEDVTILARGYALEFMRIDIPTLYLPGVFRDFGP